MTDRLLVINIKDNIGSIQLDEELDYKSIVLKSFLFRNLNILFNSEMYIRFNFLSGICLSNLNIRGLPLHHSSIAYVWNPELEIELTRKIPSYIEYDIVDKNNNRIDFSNITKFELIFSLIK